MGCYIVSCSRNLYQTSVVKFGVFVVVYALAFRSWQDIRISKINLDCKLVHEFGNSMGVYKLSKQQHPVTKPSWNSEVLLSCKCPYWCLCTDRCVALCVSAFVFLHVCWSTSVSLKNGKELANQPWTLPYAPLKDWSRHVPIIISCCYYIYSSYAYKLLLVIT